MNFITSNALPQVVAAFLIFIAGYLALLVSVVICVLVAWLFYEGSNLVWAYTVRPAALGDHVISEAEGDVSLTSRVGGALRNLVRAIHQPHHGPVAAGALHQGTRGAH